MTTHTRNSTRFAFLALLALGPATPWAPAPAEAQQIPWVGLAAPGAQLHGEIGLYPHSPGGADHLGFAVAAGDFDGDSFDDLASGIPGNDCDVVTWDCGSVQVRLGGPADPLGVVKTLDPAAPGAPEPAEAFDEYGLALAVGDFDHDGKDDLAVGIPGNEAINATWGLEGAVQIHYGLDSSQGSIQPVAEQVLLQGVNGVPFETWAGTGVANEDRFGHALAVGDFDGDGHDDLAMGAPHAKSSALDTSGNVIVAHGHAGGLMPFDGFLMRLGRGGLPDVPEAGEEFGSALAAGDFDGDGFDDLAIGVPIEEQVGAVLVVYGSPASLIFADHWYFSSLALGGEAQPGMRFGLALAAGDFDGDGRDDLAIGAPEFDGQGEPVPFDVGLVSVVYGSQAGLTPARVDRIYEDLLYGAGEGEAFDNFGWALAAGDFDGDGVDDLAIGTPGEDLEASGSGNTGAVSVLAGRRLEGLTGAARQLRPIGFTPMFPNEDPSGLIPDYRAGEPFYGTSLAAGDFDGNRFSDLAIGAPGRNVYHPSPVGDTGAAAVVYGRLFADGFETGSPGAWSSAVP